MQKYVLGFMFDELKDKVVLIKKSKPKWQEGFLNGVGGKVEPFDGSDASAMCREFYEETGVKTREDEWSFLLDMEGSGNFSVAVFYSFSGKYKNVKTMESEEVCILNVEEDWTFIRENSISNVPWLIMDSNIGRLKLKAEYV